MNLDRLRPDADTKLHHPVRLRRPGPLPLDPLGLAPLLVRDPATGRVELLLLDAEQEAQLVQPRRFFGHMFEYSAEPPVDGSPRSHPRDHPRGRGEHAVNRKRTLSITGTIPAGAGSTFSNAAPCDASGDIPAGAGSTPAGRRPCCRRGGHPRGRGEHRYFFAALTACWGTSPRARGAPVADPERVGDLGDIPAGAGSTLAELRVCHRGEPFCSTFTDSDKTPLSPVTHKPVPGAAETRPHPAFQPYTPAPNATSFRSKALPHSLPSRSASVGVTPRRSAALGGPPDGAATRSWKTR